MSNERSLAKVTLSKEEFVARFAEKGYTKKDSRVIVDDFIRTLEEVLVGGEAVMFRDFGTFSVRHRAARPGKSIKDKSPIILPAYNAPHFLAGRLLKQEIAEGRIRERE